MAVHGGAWQVPFLTPSGGFERLPDTSDDQLPHGAWRWGEGTAKRGVAVDLFLFLRDHQ